mmetsp:Transcript_6082/g.10510  ORF Transcript_6082/g.10510 Transcript_6082/m.10510 type:complete len:111 (+) Transcript_6082:105-437(+)|eukprot:CAMPEP_0196655632 /NCGR_PEP_ID=MMETSP1086-20130531/5383_1 /TAXON_ID=77921 /ORGANISM="Cyanoptyche  gloeocystis , Strain SAG4.97" /LENGTH=110 /DNA_ID=CAMNT_0041988043 /DNA_START=133 /DNA_END=465 /DNA_ORIENTATION=+
MADGMEGMTLKERIHSMRYPIKDKRMLFLVGCFYFSIPIIAGFGIMKFTNAFGMNDEKAKKILRKKLEENSLAQQTVSANKSQLQALLDEVAEKYHAEQRARGKTSAGDR